MSALKSANQELKGMMKSVKIQDIDVCNLSIFFFPFVSIESSEFSGAEQIFFFSVEHAR